MLAKKENVFLLVHFITKQSRSSDSCEIPPEVTDVTPINLALLFNMNDQEIGSLSKHCGAWTCYIKASLYDKALANQIKEDLQLVSSHLQITALCGKLSHVINRDVDQRVNLLKNHLAWCQWVEMDVEYECHSKDLAPWLYQGDIECLILWAILDQLLSWRISLHCL